MPALMAVEGEKMSSPWPRTSTSAETLLMPSEGMMDCTGKRSAVKVSS